MAKKRQPSGKLSTRLQGGLLLFHEQAGELVEESVQYSSPSHIPFSVQSIDTVDALVREPHSESKTKVCVCVFRGNAKQHFPFTCSQADRAQEHYEDSRSRHGETNLEK